MLSLKDLIHFLTNADLEFSQTTGVTQNDMKKVSVAEKQAVCIPAARGSFFSSSF